jgi:hypothetical protein
MTPEDTPLPRPEAQGPGSGSTPPQPQQEPAGSTLQPAVHEPSSATGQPLAPAREPSTATAVPAHRKGIGELAAATLAILLYVLLADMAVETVLSKSPSPIQLTILGGVFIYSILSAALWRYVSWHTRAVASTILLFALAAGTAWLPGGLTRGITMLQQPTSAVLAGVTGVVILLAAVILAQWRFVPVWGRAVLGLIALYGMAAIALGVKNGTPYADLFHGHSEWQRLPFWIQGGFLAAVLLIATLLIHMINGAMRVRGGTLRAWGLEAVLLALAIVIAAAGYIGPSVNFHSMQDGTSLVASPSPPPGISGGTGFTATSTASGQVVTPAPPSQPAAPAAPSQAPATNATGGSAPGTGAPQTGPAAPAGQTGVPAPAAVLPQQPWVRPARASAYVGTLYFTRNHGCPSVNKVAFTYTTDSEFTMEKPQAIACPPKADGLIFAPDGDLLVGGGDLIFKVSLKTGQFSFVKPGTWALHLMLDPNQQQIWTASIPGTPATIPLTPFADGTPHTLTGDDGTVTTITWDNAGNAFYTASASGGNGNFGAIDLAALKTTRLLSSLPASHGMSFDPFTRNLILMGSTHITQIDPGPPVSVVSDLVVDGMQFDQGTVDGQGHIYAASNSGHLVFVDYSATGKVGDPKNFKKTQYLADYLDDVAPLAGPGAIKVLKTPPAGDVLVRYAPEMQALNHNIEIILDASGSMETRLEHSTRLGVAKQVLGDLMKALPPGTNVAFRVFGHRKSWRDLAASCVDTELMVPLGPLSPAAIMAKVNTIHAVGDTPLVANLLLAAHDLAGARAATIVAITDGEEDCGGNVSTVATQLRGMGVQLVAHIVGFTLADPKWITTWTRVAEETGGRFFRAENTAELATALRAATHLEYVAYDAHGKLVGKSEVGTPLRLPAGTYTLVARANRPVKVEGVKVAGKATPTFVLQRKGPDWSMTLERKP